MMKNSSDRGFSLVELLVVVVVIGIVAALAVPALQKAIRATENGNTFASLKSVASSQAGYYSQNNRFGRLTEINNLMSSSIGTQSGNELIRGKFTLSMVPPAPTDAELRESYTIVAIRNVAGEGVIYEYQVTQSGEVQVIRP